MSLNVIYVYPSNSSFVKKDIDILSKKYNVITQELDWNKKIKIPFHFFRQFIFLLQNVYKCKAVFVMFGGYWSFLPSVFGKITGRPVYIILGGTDCVSFPSIDYGSLRKPILKLFIKWSYQLCDKLIPVDQSLVYSKYFYYEESRYEYQGYKYFLPEISTPYQVIYNGFDPVFFNYESSKNKKISNTFLTVASIPNMMTFKLKGIDKIFELAESLDDCTFTVIGISQNVLDQLDDIPENVKVLPFLSLIKASEYLVKSEFVLHLSVSEGFPNSLCEAMLCNCIPIVSAVGAMPHIVGETGFVIENSDINFIRSEFDSILMTSEETRISLASEARKRVVENFHIKIREESILNLVK